MTISRHPRPATAADVARAAGVSRATVSHIFNGRAGRFPEATKERVRAAAASLDYRPSPAGRSLVTGRSETIVVVVPNTTLGPNIQEALERITARMGADTNVVLRFAAADPETTINAILKLRPFAVVDLGSIAGAHRDRLVAQGVPCLPDHTRPTRADGLPLQDAIAQRQVAELLKRGQRRIVYGSLADGRSDSYGPARLAGVRKACAAHGVAPPLCIEVVPEVDATVSALRSLDAAPVGVAAYNDTVALAVLSAAGRIGLRVPDRLSVIGMDNTDVGRLWRPQLTTIDVNVDALVDDIFAQLGAELGSHQGPGDTRDTTPAPLLTLVPGEST
ncbi:LacI family DNA-binding transcriptional regulator [Amycolatopsis sp. NBRC 101858]|uniref:LacI family DNA-binding transcriptional regulator n=1 Tax=Amycolatopsis sp. NBRC 101858 TaxID=3032200 RepID=UPI002553A2B8|nr:LacI family DNA-binding transcriptional regulator [Amycolatopsis sp. NBRC 101858]